MPVVRVQSSTVQYSADLITSTIPYNTTAVTVDPTTGDTIVTPQSTTLTFVTQRTVPKVGIMFVGWGGNNGSTVTAAIEANRRGLTWRTKEGLQKADYLGSITQSSTIRLGTSGNDEVYAPLKSVVPLVEPNDLVLGGWDISRLRIGDAMERAAVLDYDLQRQLKESLNEFVPLPAIFNPDFIAANQSDRADNVLPATLTKQQQVEAIRKDIRDFKERTKVDKVIVLWTANTERFAEIHPATTGGSSQDLLNAIAANEKEISPSTLYATATVLEGYSYINGSPQNTFVPGLIALAKERNVFIAGDDFKSGQTKFKSLLVEFLVGAGIKPQAIVSYNHLGNNDGKNLSAPAQFRSKEISKSNVVDDMVASNRLMYPNPGDKPDHLVIIKYIPYVGDSKRAMDEYTASIFMGGKQTFVIHNTCEDSLLAAPLMLDLCIICELMERVQINGERMHTVASLLSYLLKAPLVPEGTPIVNALFRQKSCIENFVRSLVGLAPESNMLLEYKTKSSIF